MPTIQTVITGALVLAEGSRQALPADLLLQGDRIVAIAPAGSVSSETIRRIDATDRLIIPGLVNAHTHGHGGLAKGAGDRWSLELLLNAGGWLNGHRTDDDRYLSTLLTGVEMLRKGCTACYDLAAMLPLPTPEALHSVARAYADVGMRAVIAPDDRRPQLLPGDPRPAGRLPAGVAPAGRGGAHRAGGGDAGARSARPPRPGPIRPTASAWASRPPSRCIVRTISCAAAATWRSNTACRCRPTWPKSPVQRAARVAAAMA